MLRTLSSAWKRVAKLIIIGLLMFWLVVEVYPILFLFMTSVSTDREALNSPFTPPTSVHLENFVEVWKGVRTRQPFAVYFKNSVLVTGGTLLLLLVVASLAGYSLARGKFPGSAAVQQGFLLTLAVPIHVLLIPIFFFMTKLGLRNNLLGAILMYTTMGLPFTVYLMRAYFASFPRELEEAAMIDGCSILGAFWRVVMPMSRGAVASLAIVNVTWIWSELFFALILLKDADVRTLPLAIVGYKVATMSTEMNITGQFAAMAMAVIPMMIFYFLFQRQITKGMTMGAFR